MKKNYIYRLKHKYIKHPELLEKYGFNTYSNEEDDELVYALGIKIPEDCSITKYLIGAFEKVYEKADDKSEFSEYTFSKNGKLRLTKKVKDEFTKCQLCVVDKGIGANCLFINAPDRVEYYSTEVLDECCKAIIDSFLNDKVIYKKRNNAN